MVIDFKNDEGRITCPVATGVMGEIGAGTGLVEDMAGLIAGLKEHGIYTIARVVTFKDPYLAEKKPEWCLKTKDGSVYRDKKGDAGSIHIIRKSGSILRGGRGGLPAGI